MRKTHIVVCYLYLTAMVTCEVQEGESKNVTSVESTTDTAKVIAKRNALAGGSINVRTNEPVEEGSFGLSPLLIQVLGGVVQNMLSSKGVTAQTFGTFLNLFNKGTIKHDLLLLRRVFNLAARFAAFLNRYLPSTAALADSSSSIFQSFMTKFRFYSTQPNEQNFQWFTIDQLETPAPLPDVPPRVQMVVDFVTQRSVTSTSAAPVVVDVANDEAETVEEDETPEEDDILEEDEPEEDDTEVVEEISVVSTEAPIITEKPKEGFTAPESGYDVRMIEKEETVTTSQNQDSPVTPEEVGNKNVRVTGEAVVEEKAQQEYGLPRVEGLPIKINFEQDLPTPDLLIVDNITKFTRDEENVLPLEDDNNLNPSKPSARGLQENGIPKPEENSITYPNPVHHVYGAPERLASQEFDNEPERKRDKTGLPYQNRGEVFDGLPHYERNGRFLDNGFHPSQDPIRNDLGGPVYGSIAEIPLQRHPIFDRRSGSLRDSFGFPVRN